MGSGRTLSAAETLHYRAPFAAVRDRLPTLIWPRQIAFQGQAADCGGVPIAGICKLEQVTQEIEDYYQTVADSGVMPLSVGGPAGNDAARSATIAQ